MMSLLDWMTSHGKTMSDVARTLGVQADTVSLWLSGERLPTERRRKDLRRMTLGQVDYPFPDAAPASWRRSFMPPPAH